MADHQNPYAASQTSSADKPPLKYHGGIPQAIVLFLFATPVVGLIVLFGLVALFAILRPLHLPIPRLLLSGPLLLIISFGTGMYFGVRIAFQTMFSREETAEGRDHEGPGNV